MVEPHDCVADGTVRRRGYAEASGFTALDRIHSVPLRLPSPAAFRACAVLLHNCMMPLPLPCPVIPDPEHCRMALPCGHPEPGPVNSPSLILSNVAAQAAP